VRCSSPDDPHEKDLDVFGENIIPSSGTQLPALLPALTGLRFVAAMMIVWLHAHQIFGLPNPGHLAQGVSFFFVLSGFILTHVYPRLAGAAAVKRFFIARIARIWPAHLATLALFMMVEGGPINGFFLANLLLVQSWIPVANSYFSYNGISWSISTEVFFYLMFPLMIASFGKRWLFWLLASAIVSIGFFAMANNGAFPLESGDHVSITGLIYINPAVRLFEFVLGMCCCLFWKRLQSVRLPDSALLFTVLECAAIGIAIFFMQHSVLNLVRSVQPAGGEWVGHHASGMWGFGAVLIVFALGRGLLARLFASRPAMLLGEISFSLYLVHQWILNYFSGHLKGLSKAPWQLGFLFALAVALALAYLIWLLVEMPARRLIRDLGAGKPFALRKSAQMLGSSIARPSALLLTAFLVAFGLFAERLNDYPDTVLAAADAVPKSTVLAGGLCHLDLVKSRPSMFGELSSVEFSGWAFDDRSLLAPPELRLRLISREADFLVPLARVQRPDVSKGFKLASDAQAGWTAKLGLSAMRGQSFGLAIEQRRGDWLQCKLGNRLEIGASEVLLKP
jgi:peptidoglycan/LPS O-acetylase OafA/YrhL